jgi:hypothetical protein
MSKVHFVLGGTNTLGQRVPTRKFKSYVCRGHVEHELNGEMVSIDVKEKAGEASVHVEQRP